MGVQCFGPPCIQSTAVQIPMMRDDAPNPPHSINDKIHHQRPVYKFISVIWNKYANRFSRNLLVKYTDEVLSALVKPRQHQQQCWNNVRLCRSIIRICCQNGNDVERVYRKMSSFRQSRTLLGHCCRFWQQCCRFWQQYRTTFFVL